MSSDTSVSDDLNCIVSSVSQASDATLQVVADGKSETRGIIVDPLSDLPLVGTYTVNEFWV